jgi:hypothetical protein
MSTIFAGVAPPNAANFNGVIGNNFVVNHQGNSTGGWFYRTAGNPIAQVTMGLYRDNGHVLLTSQNQAGLAAGAWNFIPWAAPVALTAGEMYVIAAYTHDGQLGSTPGALNNVEIFNSPFTVPNQSGRVLGSGALTFPTGFFADAYGVDTEFVLTEPAPCPPCPPTEGFLINLTSPGFVAIVTGLAGCVFGALAQTPAGAPCRQCVLLPTQQIPWDNCGPCEEGCDGQAAFAIREVYGSDTFPLPAAQKTWSKCGPRYTVARVVVSVTRCVPGMDERGESPSCAAELAAAIILENDRTAVRQGLACCLHVASTATPAFLSEWLISPSVTVGELGQCAGSETEFLVGVRSCICPD